MRLPCFANCVPLEIENFTEHVIYSNCSLRTQLGFDPAVLGPGEGLRSTELLELAIGKVDRFLFSAFELMPIYKD